MKDLPSGCIAAVLTPVLGIIGLSVYFSIDREPRAIEPKDVCHYAYVWMPREQIMTLIRSGKYRTEEVSDFGSCEAKKLASALWYASGTTEVPALRSSQLPQLRYEAFLVVSTDKYDPAVRSFGPQLLPCSFRVDGVDSVSNIAPRGLCGKALNFASFKDESRI